MRAVTYVLLAATGLALGVIGAFLVPLRFPGHVEGLAVLIAVLGNFTASFLGGIGTRRQLGAVLPAAGWFVVIGTLSTVSVNHDVVIPGSLPSDPGIVKVGEAFLILGLIGSAAGIAGAVRFTSRGGQPTHSE